MAMSQGKSMGTNKPTKPCYNCSEDGLITCDCDDHQWMKTGSDPENSCDDDCGEPKKKKPALRKIEKEIKKKETPTRKKEELRKKTKSVSEIILEIEKENNLK